jgi:hypothetical protein
MKVEDRELISPLNLVTMAIVFNKGNSFYA